MIHHVIRVIRDAGALEAANEAATQHAMTARVASDRLWDAMRQLAVVRGELRAVEEELADVRAERDLLACEISWEAR